MAVFSDDVRSGESASQNEGRKPRDNNVYILGAGFSAEAGLPVMGEFLRAVREYYDSAAPIRSSLEPHYRAVLNFRRRAMASRDVLDLNLDNIETLFSLADMEETLREEGETGAASIKHVIADTVTHPFARGSRLRVGLPLQALRADPSRLGWVERYRDESDRQRQDNMYPAIPVPVFAVALLSGLFDRPGQTRSNTIITFNYDTVVEDALARCGGRPDYGSSRLSFSGSWTPERPEFTVPLLKLHGSSNWAAGDADAASAVAFPMYGMFPNGEVPLVIPPTWKKGSLSPLIQDIWRRAYRALAAANRIYVFGYSMPSTDLHFRHLMAAALQENPGLYQLVVVDPEPSELSQGVAQRYAGLFAPLNAYGRLAYHATRLRGVLLQLPQRPFELERGELVQSVGDEPLRVQ